MLIYLQMLETEEERQLMECFYNEYKDKMMRVALSILRNNHDAEEAVHQAFLRLCNNTLILPKEICHKTEGFFVLIVRNIAIDIYRKQKKTKVVSFEEEFMETEAINDVETQVLDRVSEEALSALITKLPSQYSESLIMKYYYGYSDKDCSKLLGVKPDAFRKRLERARKLLASECIKEGIIE